MSDLCVTGHKTLGYAISKHPANTHFPRRGIFPLNIFCNIWASRLNIAVSAIIYPSVLVAEDSVDTRIMLKRAFELKGYRVFEAEDGQQALDIARRYNPSLLVIDLNMPVLDGLETIKNFRKFEGDAQHTPIVAITAYDVYGMKEAALETGCNKYLSKPLDLAELDRTLKSLGFIV